MSKPTQSIKLNKKEDAIIYYKKTLGENITTRKRAAVIFYAEKGDNTITEIHRKSGCTQVFVRSTIKGYLEKGIDYIYECSRGIKKSVLDSIETELLAEFEKNPPSSIPEAVSQIKEKFGITLTKLRSDIGLEKGALLPQILGAVKFSRVWLIPKDAEKLIDGRCKRLS